MFKDVSVRKKLYYGFGAIVVMLVVLLALAFSNLAVLSNVNQSDRHTMRVLMVAEKLRAEVLESRVAYRGFLLNGDPAEFRIMHENENHLDVVFTEFKSLIVDDPEQLQRLRKIEELTADWYKSILYPMVQKRRELSKVSGSADQMAREPLYAAGGARVAAIDQLIDQLDAEEHRRSVERAEQSGKLHKLILMMLPVGGLICVLASIVVAYMLGRAILRQLDELTRAAKRIASGEQGARAKVLNNDELGEVAREFNQMAQAIQDHRAAELDATNLLNGKVDSLLAAVSKATAGDLTGNITVGGNDAIGQLGEGLARMFDNLRTLLFRVQKAGIQVTTSTTEIAAFARQQEATGVEHAQTSVEVLSTTKEISANTAQLLKTMGEATDVADYTATKTAEAQLNLKRMDQTMQKMVGATESINAKLAALSDKASNINHVLTTIAKVADQTNILSLNAAIEAEKAGEAGRGFSVVATEIRRLADQTSVATWDIEQMLKEMQSAVSASVMGMDKFSEEVRRGVDEVREVGEQLSSVIQQVQELPPRFDAVLEGMQSQAIGASQINETMAQLNEATQQTVDSLRATSEAVHQLQYAAQDLQASVSLFAVNE